MGLVLCGVYAAIIGVCVGYAQLGGLDVKSQFVFLQLPIVLQSAAAYALGLAGVLVDLSWPAAYLIFAGPVFILLYLIGVWCDRGLLRKVGRL